MPIKNKENDGFLFLLGRFLFKILFNFFYRLEICGIENIPESGGAIIAPNHTSFFDPPIVGSAIKRPLNFMAKQELFQVPIFGWVIRQTNAFPVKRGSTDMNAVRNAFFLLENGNLLLMFPEGTRSNDGQIGKAKVGIGMVACNTQVPIIPTKIENANKMSRLKKIKITFEKPVYPPKNFEKKDYILLSQQTLDCIKNMR